MAETTPKSIGRYEIRRELGRGSMGVVYEAHDPLLSRTVALKTIHLAFSVDAEDGSFEERFFAEAKAAAQLSHPGIVVVYDVGRDPESGRLYIALEYLLGTTLETALTGGRTFEWREALLITSRMADALHHAHSRGIVHRDIKPGNVILQSDEPTILDFGIAKLLTSQKTTGNRLFGSPSYMSPERAAGENLETRSDIFSLGAVMYELLTGKKAFGGPNLQTILTRVAYEDPLPPSQLVPGVPEDVDYVVARALAKDLDDRYPTGEVLAEDLTDILAGQAPRHRHGYPAPNVPRGTDPSHRSSGSLPAAASASKHPRARKQKGDSTARGGTAPTLALPPGKRVSLAILAGARQGEVIVFQKPQVLIGRAGGRANADVEIADPEVSRAHAIVECHGNRIVLRDLDSRNGTFVDLERIAEREIENHGEFRIGRTRFMLILSDLD